MPPNDTLQIKDVLDGIGHAVLLFDSDGNLVQYNRAAATVVGADLKLLKSQGWKAATTLFKPYESQGVAGSSLEEVRREASTAVKPIRFQILIAGEYTPCWASAVADEKGAVFTMITIDTPDWTALTDIVNIFRKEVKETVAATRGHIDIITKSMTVVGPEDPVKNLTKRIGGFNQLIDMQMFRTKELIAQMERFEDIRTGDLREYTRTNRKKLDIAFFLEDFLEEMENADLLDPETEAHDYRGRISFDVSGKLVANVARGTLTRVLRDILRNAIMYSMMATPITIKAKRDGNFVQIDVADEGYGIRQKEWERVFTPFQRARQPQIIAEFGYGLSLYLCKNEVEAMNGKMWFDSEEKVGSTFSIKLPAWREPEPDPKPAAESSSSSTSSDKE